MFDIGKILKRAWQILWNYKVLWIFGLLLALTGAGGGSTGGQSRYTTNYNDTRKEFNGFNQNYQGRYETQAWMNQASDWAQQHVVPLFSTPERTLHTIILMLVVLFGICIIIGLLLALVRYPAETAVIRMVDEHETTGSKVKFKEGWKLGWNRRAFRMWLVDLLVGVPAFVYVLMLMGLTISLILNERGLNSTAWAGMAGLIVLFILLTLVFVVFMIGLSLLRHLIVRFVAIDGMTVGQAFASGWAMFKKNFGRLLLTWLVMLVIGIGFGIALIAAFLILIPTYAIMAIPAAIVAAIPGAIGYGIASIFAHGWLAWVIAALVALPFLFTVMFSPLSFVNGWYIIFDSNVYTLVFRQFKLIASVPPVEAAAAPVTPVAPTEPPVVQ
jgi:hypothetical protein